MCSNYTGDVEPGTGIAGWYHVDFHFRAGTSSYHALHKYENIGHAEVPEDHLYNMYVYEYIT